MQRSQAENYERQPFVNARADVGARQHVSRASSSHWLHLLNAAIPLIVGEMIKDPEKKWRTTRAAMLGTAFVGEAIWAHRVRQEKCRER